MENKQADRVGHFLVLAVVAILALGLGWTPSRIMDWARYDLLEMERPTPPTHPAKKEIARLWLERQQDAAWKYECHTGYVAGTWDASSRTCYNDKASILWKVDEFGVKRRDVAGIGFALSRQAAPSVGIQDLKANQGVTGTASMSATR